MSSLTVVEVIGYAASILVALSLMMRSIVQRKGIRKIISDPGIREHALYLQKMGFHPETTPGGERVYCLSLD